MDKIEDVIRRSHLDYVVIYSQLDANEARKIHNVLTLKRLNGCLFDDPSPFPDFDDNNEQAILGEILNRTTLKLFLVSENFTSDIADVDFVVWKNNALSDSIRYRDQSVIPLWLTPKRDLPRAAARNLYGLMALQGLNPARERYSSDLVDLIDKEMFLNMKETRIQEQIEHVRNAPQKISQTINQNGSTIHNKITVYGAKDVKIIQQTTQSNGVAEKAAPTASGVTDEFSSLEVSERYWRKFDKPASGARKQKVPAMRQRQQAWETDGPLSGETNGPLSAAQSESSSGSILPSEMVVN